MAVIVRWKIECEAQRFRERGLGYRARFGALKIKVRALFDSSQYIGRRTSTKAHILYSLSTVHFGVIADCEFSFSHFNANVFIRY